MSNLVEARPVLALVENYHRLNGMKWRKITNIWFQLDTGDDRLQQDSDWWI